MVLEIVLKGIRKEVINPNKINPEKLARYIRGVRNLGINDPIEDIGKHQLLKMMKAQGVVTKAGDEMVEDVAVLKKGEHIGEHNGWGWTHIKQQHIDTGNFDFVFGHKTDDEIIEMIQDTLLTNPVQQVYEEKMVFENEFPDENGVMKKLRVVVSEKPESIGSIQTAYPV